MVPSSLNRPGLQESLLSPISMTRQHAAVPTPGAWKRRRAREWRHCVRPTLAASRSGASTFGRAGSSALTVWTRCESRPTASSLSHQTNRGTHRAGIHDDGHSPKSMTSALRKESTLRATLSIDAYGGGLSAAAPVV